MANLTTIIFNGINNPECSYFVGYFLGQSNVFGRVIMIFMLFTLYKLVNTLAFDPLLKWIKTKIKHYFGDKNA